MAIGEFDVVRADYGTAVNYIPAAGNTIMCMCFGGTLECQVLEQGGTIIFKTTANGLSTSPDSNPKHCCTNTNYWQLNSSAASPAFIQFTFLQVG
jgi:hypothetical protein